jgi:hypothetical protein
MFENIIGLSGVSLLDTDDLWRFAGVLPNDKAELLWKLRELRE